MISRLIIRGLGPHEDTDLTLDPTGVQTIEGASETGKSTLLEAVLLCLYGEDSSGGAFPAEAIRGDACDVEIHTARGSTLSRILTTSRKIRRSLDRGSGPVAYTTEAEWRAQLGALGKLVDAIRLALVPFEWARLLAGEGGGRPLRDALARILPAADVRAVVAELLGRALDRTESTDERVVYEQRAAANRAHDKAAGLADGLG